LGDLDLQQYRAEIYRILSAKGMIEHNGEIHFPESAVMDAVEFIYLEIKNIPVENIESKIIEAANRAFAKLANQSGLKENGLRSDDAAGIEDDKF
jgi:pimeloyl-CoA synthetase